MNTFRKIDMDTWPRAAHCRAFRDSLLPSYCVTVELDITHFLAQVRAQGWSLTLAMTYAACHCANDIGAFRYRFLDGDVVLYDRIDAAFIWLNPETELFKVVNVPLGDTMRAFIPLAARTAQEQKEYFTGPLGNDVFQCSAMPWVRYTHVSHTESGKKGNAAALFNWGKYFTRHGRTLLPFSIQAHHSFVDGLHVGRLVEHLQNWLDAFDAEKD